MLGGGHRFEYEFDYALGIPVINYGVRCGVHVGRQINPLHLALYACKQLGLEPITGPIVIPRIKEVERKEYVWRAVDWLVSNERRRGHFSVWEYDFPFPPLLRAPWRCALTEAFGALLLLVAGKRDQARRHLESMLTDYRDGGVAQRSREGLWLLEYVSEKPPSFVRTPPLVLNCMLHCLLIMRECGLRLDDHVVNEAFELGFHTLKRDLGRFDAGFYTYYDERGNPADEKYHILHVELLRLLYAQVKDDDLLPWIDRWARLKRMYALLEPLIFLRHLIRSKGMLYI
jgi:hypothetical protein